MIFVKNSRGGREVNMINTLSKINLPKIGWEGGRSTSIWIMSLNILFFFLRVPLRYLCIIGNGKDFSGKFLIGGLPPPPDTDAFSAVAGVSFARILVTPGVIFSCDEQLKK